VIQGDDQTYGAIWGLIGLVLAADWVAYGMPGNSSQVSLTAIIVLAMLLGGESALLLRRH
jgi:hypothetical protein